MYFLIKRPFCTTIRENASINIHPQSKYPTYTLKTLMNIINKKKKLNIFEKKFE